jgi:regulator of protease activity HflC (stomatin/prohibitin superfamily)
LNTDRAVLIEDKDPSLAGTNEYQQLITAQQATANMLGGPFNETVFIPEGLQDIVEIRYKHRVLPYQAMFYKRQGEASYVVKLPGQSFFLPAYTTITPLRWSVCDSTCVKHDVEWIDLRSRQLFYTFDMTTQDNVKVEVKGIIFWQVVDPNKIMGPNAVSDPVQDIWVRAQSQLKSVVQSTQFSVFKSSMNTIRDNTFNLLTSGTVAAHFDQVGVVVSKFEISGYAILSATQEANLQTQIVTIVEGIKTRKDQENKEIIANLTVTHQKLYQASLGTLLGIQATNNALRSSALGEAAGYLEVSAAATFIDGLNDTISNETQRVELYKHRDQIHVRNVNTADVSAMGATMFTSPDELNMQIGATFGSTLAR